MKLFSRKKPKIQGEIGYYGLADWWLETFTEDEQKHIDDTFAPFSSSGPIHRLIRGDIQYSTQPIGLFLSGLAGWFSRTDRDRDIARRILAKAVEVMDPKKDIWGAHFTYQTLIETWYRDRDSLPNALEEAIKACHGQIALAPQAARAWKREYPDRPLPGHVGFKQMTIILDKQGKHAEAIKVAQQAMRQGWADDWDKRIERYQKKLGK